MRHERQTWTVAVTGSGGSGAVTAGQILLAAIAHAGFHGLMMRSAGPQIRGGESATMIRFGAAPVTCMGDTFDMVVGLDWGNVERFIDEIPLTADSTILADPASGPTPDGLAGSGAGVVDWAFQDAAAQVEGGRVNMVAVGALGVLTGLPPDALESGVRATLQRKGAAVVDAALACVRSAYATGAEPIGALAPHLPSPPRWNISGNEASGLGAIRGGVRFVAAYPITPASEILEWLAPHLERVGGSLLQAEDELASVNMIIGGSFGGVPSLTATSGPGLSLMLEGLGLAVASETPVVVVNVMRGGPSTGIPTKSEQSDFNIAVYGMHGDAPHLVFAALDIADCAFTTQWAVRLAEHLQTVAIVLSDQSLGQSRAVSKPPQQFLQTLERRVAAQPGPDYDRYALTGDGVSPMSIPGTGLGMYTGDGLEHNPHGTPSSLARDHAQQGDKRLHKLLDFDYGAHWAEIRGSGPDCIVTWGSASGAAFEAAARRTAAGQPTRVIALRLLLPLQHAAFTAALEGARRVLVVEQNQGAQCFHYLHAEQALPADAGSHARPGPLALRPGEIIAALNPED